MCVCVCVCFLFLKVANVSLRGGGSETMGCFAVACALVGQHQMRGDDQKPFRLSYRETTTRWGREQEEE